MYVHFRYNGKDYIRQTFAHEHSIQDQHDYYLILCQDGDFLNLSTAFGLPSPHDADVSSTYYDGLTYTKLRELIQSDFSHRLKYRWVDSLSSQIIALYPTLDNQAFSATLPFADDEVPQLRAPDPSSGGETPSYGNSYGDSYVNCNGDSIGNSDGNAEEVCEHCGVSCTGECYGKRMLQEEISDIRRYDRTIGYIGQIGLNPGTLNAVYSSVWHPDVYASLRQRMMPDVNTYVRPIERFGL